LADDAPCSSELTNLSIPEQERRGDWARPAMSSGVSVTQELALDLDQAAVASAGNPTTAASAYPPA
jgi:hypothetical protein